MLACGLVEGLKGSFWSNPAQLSTDLSIVGSILLALPLVADARRVPDLLAAVDSHKAYKQIDKDLFVFDGPPKLAMPIVRRGFWFALVLEFVVLTFVFKTVGHYSVAGAGIACLFLVLCEMLSGYVVTGHLRAGFEWYVASDFRLQAFLSASHWFGLCMFLLGVGLLAASLALNHWPTEACQPFSASTTPAR